VCLSSDVKDKRLRVSIWIYDTDFSFVIDCGPDFRQQMLASGCRKIDAIIFTHEHADHTAGLDDIRPFNFRQGDMPVYAHQRVIQSLKRRFDYIFAEDKYPGAPSVITHEITSDEPILISGQKVIPIDAMHGDLQVFGYRIGDIVYLTDVKTITEEEVVKLNGVKILIINALREEPHKTHFNLEEALAFIEKVAPEKAFLTHISHNMGFHEIVQQKLPKNVFLAYDNLEITI
jgi:phosphoribosyl 1,2-cyclic phosphate phosphodiesterase